LNIVRTTLPVRILSAACALLLAAASVAHASPVTLTADASVNSAHPTANYGTLANLFVNGNAATFIQYDLSSLPAGLAPNQVAKATLTIFVNRVNTGGAVSLSPVLTSWTESAVTYASQPTLGNAATSFTAANAGQYVTLDVTSIVQGWISLPASNFGLALTSSAASLQLDSKENDETAHAPVLDVTITSTGATGATGAQGPQGIQGIQGLIGATGAQGNNGLAGANGAAGPQGLQGATGVTGVAGAVGPSGAVGAVGATGIQGLQGVTGPQGATGAVGAAGQIGATGSTGANGIAGVAGPAGATGVTGANGIAGVAGPAGATGVTGANGIAGVAGPAGATGVTGATGANGIAGVAGPAGTTGATGQIGATGTTGATGLAGSTGSTGTTGATGQVGATGATGSTGTTGATGVVGSTGATGASSTGGTYSSAVTYTPGSVVQSSGTTYLCLSSSCTGTTPGGNSSIWSPITGSSGGGASVELLATNNNTQSIPVSSTTTVQFNSLTVAPSTGSFNSFNYSYTAGVTGNYQVIVTLVSSTIGSIWPAIFINGVQTDYGPGVQNTSATGYLSRGSLAVVKRLNAGDNLYVGAYNINTATASSIPTNVSTFSIVSLNGGGSAGATGATGATGPAGPQGPQGIAGPAGTTGATGPAGSGGGSSIYGDGSSSSSVCTIASNTNWVTADPGGLIQCANFSVSSGVTLTVPTGTKIRATGTVTIAGNIVVSAANQQSAVSTTLGSVGASIPALPAFTLRHMVNPVFTGGGSGGVSFPSGTESFGGGSITILSAGAITISPGGSITANGNPGLEETGYYAGGGGAGGIIIIASKSSVANNGSISALGGQGGPGLSSYNDPGAGGGGGFVHILAPSITSGTVILTGGAVGSGPYSGVGSSFGGGAGGGSGGVGSSSSVQATAGATGLLFTDIVSDPATVFVP
jgi:hypothetical protein